MTDAAKLRAFIASQDCPHCKGWGGNVRGLIFAGVKATTCRHCHSSGTCTVSAFARQHGLALRSVQSWVSGARATPKRVLAMIPAKETA